MPVGALTSTHAFSGLPQWTPEQNWVVPGPIQRQLPAQGCPQPMVPAGAQVGGSVVEVVVGAAAGAHSNLAGPGITVLLPN